MNYTTLLPLGKLVCTKEKDRYGQVACGCDPTAVITKIPLFARPRIVGTVVAREAVQWAYENLIWEMPCLHLKDFIREDVFHLGITPGICKFTHWIVTLDTKYDCTSSQAAITALAGMREWKPCLLDIKIHGLAIIEVLELMDRVNHIKWELKQRVLDIDVWYQYKTYYGIEWFNMNVTEKWLWRADEWIALLNTRKIELLQIPGRGWLETLHVVTVCDENIQQLLDYKHSRDNKSLFRHLPHNW
ncbi:hypothetical protein K491DRAFT_503965 [Lophiostoma macrostomum CBS 122681]|uniref:Uncharacterized protein n=1 Tax=Lophiostoma macrostomum CBS 122681 TaxID=1314788 RepID=A0A6A6TN87_9PLEO|nr:hypothetical protein K491DRAFT_503965 [Lophiostoma macrostomum CBS 122681]